MTSQSSDTPKNRSTVKDYLDILSSLASLITVFIGLIWIVGRAFSTAYFEQANIPFSQINLSIWDYGEVSFGSVFIGIILFTVVIIINIPSRDGKAWIDIVYDNTNRFLYILIVLLFFIIGCYLFLYRGRLETTSNNSLFTGLSTFIMSISLLLIIPVNRSLKNSSTKTSSSRDLLTYVSYILLGFSIIITMITNASIAGKRASNRLLTYDAMKIKILSSEPIFYDTTIISSTSHFSDTSIYIYEGLHLITYNSEKYFLFQKLDENCQPEQVYVIEDAELLHVEYTRNTTQRPCTSATPTVTATPSLTPVPTPTP